MTLQPAHPGTSYRADIDGLRALAIVPVVLYHANLGVPGGFVGVDVFFVISGFLITRIIFNEMVAGTFTYADFYERRIRRLLPAAFAVFAATTLYALAAMTWFDAESYGRSLASATLYLANFNFYWDTGYFSDDATTMPLLHTWSLAVEEQFYIGVPVLMALLVRWLPRHLIVWTLAALTAAGFVLCVWLTSWSPMFAYFLLPGRAWELALGGVLALTGTGWVRSRGLAEALTLAGAGLILLACLTINDATPYPGWHAAMPVVGSAALLAAGHYQGTLVNRLLCAAPMVWVGRISYSLYLWHWPIIVAIGYGAARVGGLNGWLAVAISVVLAALSVRFIEEPVRRRTVLARRRHLFIAAAAGSALFIAAGLVLYLGKGFPQRFAGRADLIEMVDASRWYDRMGHCYDISEGRIAGGNFCVRGREDTAPTFALIGDSHAQALAPGIFEAAGQMGVAGAQLASAGYFPAPGRTNLGINYAPDLTPELFAWLDQNPEVRTLIMAGYWQYEATSVTYRHKGTIFADEGYDGSGIAYNPVAFANMLDRLVRRFPDRQFVFFDDVPTGRELYSRHYVRGVIGRGKGLGMISRQEAIAARSTYAPILQQLAERHDNVVYLPVLEDLLCDPTACRLIGENGQPRYRDGDHLTAQFSRQIAPQLAAALAPYLAPERRPRD